MERKIKIFAVLLVIAAFNTGCLATLLGGASGALIGGGLGGKKGTALGAGLGLIAGSVVDYYHGRFYEERSNKGFEFPPPSSSPFPEETKKEELRRKDIDRRVILIAKDGRRWEGEIPVMAVVTKELRKKGATVLDKKDSSVTYRLEFYTERNGGAFVYLFLIRQADDAIVANGLGSSQFYNGYSNDNSPWEYAACRAMANLM